jgi:hypothetical protein
MKTIKLTFTDEEMEALSTEAKLRGISPAALIRYALERQRRRQEKGTNRRAK